MQVIGDQIVGIYHTGGVQQAGAVVDRYAILLNSGHCIELGEHDIVASDHRGMHRDPAFDGVIGMTIVGVEKNEEYWPTCGIRLSNGTALVMGSPVPYYWGLCEDLTEGYD